MAGVFPLMVEVMNKEGALGTAGTMGTLGERKKVLSDFAEGGEYSTAWRLEEVAVRRVGAVLP